MAMLLIEGVMSREESSAVVLILVELQEKYTQMEKKNAMMAFQNQRYSNHYRALYLCVCVCTSRSEWNLL